MNSIAENVARVMRERGYKQKAVAARAGYTEKQLSDMLNGRRIIKAEDMLALSRAMNATLNELYGVGQA